jgi:uncharacterized membrane protein YhaH (DUF805 family)
MINEKMGHVSFGQAFKDFFKGYVDFLGRSTRAGYWWMQLLLGALFAVFYIWLVVLLVLVFTQHPDESSFLSFLPLILFVLIAGLGLILPTVALQVRRYRDVGLRGRGALVLLVFNFLTGILRNIRDIQRLQTSRMFHDASLMANAPSITISGIFLFVLSFAISIFLFVLTVLPSDAMTTTSTNGFVRFFIREKHVPADETPDAPDQNDAP